MKSLSKMCAFTPYILVADYTGRVSLLVVKRPDMFGFRNPGRMRVPVEQALAGGISDCRNHGIQNLFRYVGLGDHAGSGIPSILKSWQSQHWRTPLLYEDPTNDLTLLELRTLSLLPDESVQNLHTRFGDSFLSLSELQRIALITAETEGYVSHSRMRSLSTAHSSDLSAILTGLVKDGFLEKEGETRASIYSIKGTRPKKPFMQDLYPNSPDKAPNSPDKASSSPHLAPRSQHLASRSQHLASRSQHLASRSPHLVFQKYFFVWRKGSQHIFLHRNIGVNIQFPRPANTQL